VTIVFGDGGDDGFHLGYQDFDIKHRGSHNSRIGSQRDSGFDLCQTALIGNLAGRMM